MPAALGLQRSAVGLEGCGLFGGECYGGEEGEAGDGEEEDGIDGEDLFGDLDPEPGDGDAAMGGEGSSTSRGRGRGGGRGRAAKAKAGQKTPKPRAAPKGKTQTERWEICPLFCKTKVLLLPKQKGCSDCYRDLECLRRDAAAAGTKTKQILKDLEKPVKEDELYELWAAWRKVVGPRSGQPRCGLFKWLKYVEFFEHRAGQRKESVIRWLTRKQFCAHFVEKGMAQEWSDKEWERRLQCDDYAKSSDAECGLLTMSALVYHQMIGFEEFSKGRRLEQGLDAKAGKDAVDTMLKEGALTEGSVNCVSADKMKDLQKNGLSADALGLVEKERQTAREEWWENPTGASDNATGVSASVTPRPKDNPEGSPSRLRTGDLEFDAGIEVLEVKASLSSRVHTQSAVLVKPLEKAERVAMAAATSGAHYADALKAFNARIDCIKKVLHANRAEFKTYKATVLTVANSTFPLGKQAFEELDCVKTLLFDVENIGTGVESRAELSRKVRDLEVKLEVFPVLKASLERCQKMVEGGTRSSDQQVMKAMKARETQAQELRKRSAGLANASEAAFKAHNIFALDFSSTKHLAFAAVEVKAAKDLDVPWWIPQSELAVSTMEFKGIRLNHVVFKARFAQDKSKKRDFKGFTDPEQATRALFKQVVDPVQDKIFCCEDNAAVTAMHCFGYHNSMTYSGPDLCCAGTLRLTASKSADRAVVSFQFAEAHTHVKATNTSGHGSASTDPKMTDVIQFMRSLDQASLERLPFKVYHGVFGPHTLVYQPPGFVMFEKSLGTIVTGVVATFMPCSPQTSANLQAIVSLTQGVSIQGLHHSLELVVVYMRVCSACLPY